MECNYYPAVSLDLNLLMFVVVVTPSDLVISSDLVILTDVVYLNPTIPVSAHVQRYAIHVVG